ncbi:hypothetical protein MXAN_4515 [Myxococcus xanthus DK 1622]|uniref:Uncharacterized protein n=1 Tax=Myxococcus xanthus (strain DK1622) TaxID=246197 RepID=Q1D3U0_MYXXD|nr:MULTISPECIES: hypothetical protein [Myxococcus]ABF91051.1 hypothetical protein MXAN_4515 [Myxococcus xanthus DK 1622]NOJ53157.1 hypothetical protein [Myxococcus xanthus]QPM77089.1 hypothetical protein I5Q59_22345 [Myxococcus xanthus]QQR41965.1 hypothetical protein JKA73_22815 [Myxococcus xanthus]QVW66157.1 hypothetical protein JTM82_27700 [Myxococcus xanthus DZ2]
MLSSDNWTEDARASCLFARKMSARFISKLNYGADFRRATSPLIAMLDEVPAST